jgi:PKD repeat protein
LYQQPNSVYKYSQLATEYYWNFGDGTYSTDVNPSHTYTQAGTYYVTLIANNPTSCNMADTMIRPVLVESLQSQISDTSVCYGNSVILTASANGNSLPLTFVWDDQLPIQDTLNQSVTNPSLAVIPSQTQNYYVLISDGICSLLDTVNVNVNRIVIQTTPDTMLCANSNATIHATVISSTGQASYQWAPGQCNNVADQILQVLQNQSINNVLCYSYRKSMDVAPSILSVLYRPIYGTNFSSTNPVLFIMNATEKYKYPLQILFYRLVTPGKQIREVVRISKT